MSEQTIDHTTLSKLVEAGAVRDVTVVGTAKGWNLVVKYGLAERLLASRVGTLRTWRKLDTVSGYLRQLGVARFEVDAAGFDPDSKGQRRPDRATAMRALYDAGEHDKWFREQVETAVKEADSPDAEWIEGDDWQRRIAAKRRALEAKAEVAEQ